MNRYFTRRFVFFALILGLLGIALVYMLFNLWKPSVPSKIHKDGYYTFDPDSILRMLSQDNTDVFSPQAADFEPIPTLPDVTVQWSQSDFLQIAGALHSQFWNNTIDDWKLHYMYFSSDCGSVGQGPQQGAFEFYKLPQFFLERGYEESINIDASTKTIWLKTEELGSNTRYSESIDLSQLRISVSDAFQIAEDNGGYLARMKVKNDCRVSALLAPDGSAKDWEVRYFSRESSNILEIHIDELTGKIEPVYP